MAISQELANGLQLHQTGRLHEAEAVYRGILANRPGDANAWHLLGVIAHQAGKHAKAIDFIQRAVELNPRAAPFHGNLGNAC